MLDRAEGERKSLSFGTPSRNHIMGNDDLYKNLSITFILFKMNFYLGMYGKYFKKGDKLEKLKN